MIELYLIFISLATAAVGIYISFLNWRRWNEIDLSTLKAKVFLDRSFLKYDFKFTLSMVMLVSFHITMEYMELQEIFPDDLHLVYYSIFPIVLLILVIMEYRWYILLHRKISEVQK